MMLLYAISRALGAAINEWQKILRPVSSLHFRKASFIGGFQALAGGARHIKQRSFLERARHVGERVTGVTHVEGKTTRTGDLE